MTEDKKAFTVTDRRHFTADGDVRSEDATGPERQAPAPGPWAADEDPVEGPEPPGQRFDFLALVTSLGAQALMLLGEPLAPGQDALPPDLPRAREVIDLLEDLQRRTQERRSPEEDAVLEHLLFDLRMRFVRSTGRA